MKWNVGFGMCPGEMVAQKMGESSVEGASQAVTATWSLMSIFPPLIFHDIAESRSKADSFSFHKSLSAFFAPHESTQTV